MIRSNTSSGCIFCNIINGKAPCWKVYEDNLVIAFLVFKYRPEFVLLQILGLVSFVHLVLYLILGSFNNEKIIRKLSNHITDDVPNKYWYIAVPIALGVVLYFGNFYLELLKSLI